MAHFIPFQPNFNARKVAVLFKNHSSRHYELLLKIISDRDPIFMSNFRKNLFTILSTKLSPSFAYPSQTNGLSEIMNLKIEEMIPTFVNFDKSNWDEHLIILKVAYNSSVNAITTCTPFYLNYGIHPFTIPIAILSSANPAANNFLRSIQHATKEAHRAILKANEATA